MSQGNLSLAQIVASLSPEEQEAALEGVDMDYLLYDWQFWGRPSQFIPAGDWNVTLVNAGRGFGKTRLASEWVREEAKYTNTGVRRFALVGRTVKDTRDVMLDGDSGLLSVTPPSERPEYQPSKNRLVWPNGNTGTLYTADEPSNLRGPQFTHSWADEIAAWRRMPDDSGLTAWDNLRIATRLGANPKVLATTTPKRSPLMIDLIKEHEKNPAVIQLLTGATSENAGNLAQSYLNHIYGVYGGTAVAKQELEGQMLEAIAGALWDIDRIEKDRFHDASIMPPLRVVGVDPSVAENPKDECGIVVVGSTTERSLHDRRAWVLEDATIWGAPSLWAQQVVEAARRWNAPVVAETNQGGALVVNAIHAIDPSIRVLEVKSKVGKMLRAEPITLAYDQHRVRHVGAFPELEDQMTSWMPEDSKKSPDRVDALVHALTALLISPPKGLFTGPLTTSPVSNRRINVGPTAARAGRRSTGGGRSAGGFRMR